MIESDQLFFSLLAFIKRQGLIPERLPCASHQQVCCCIKSALLSSITYEVVGAPDAPKGVSGESQYWLHFMTVSLHLTSGREMLFKYRSHEYRDK